MKKYQEALNSILDKCYTAEEDYDYEDNLITDYQPLESEDTDVKMLQELVDEREKYKWHDLRKNPNDLPGNRDIEIIFLTKDSKKIVGYYNNMFIAFGSGLLWEKHEVIAWKEIEKFKED